MVCTRFNVDEYAGLKFATDWVMQMRDAEAKLTLIGGPTLLIEMNGVRLLTDPTFDPPQEYKSGDIVLRKTMGPAIPATTIGDVDAVLLSHPQHWDNFDHAGREFAAKRARRILTTRSGKDKLGPNCSALGAGISTMVKGSVGGRVYVITTPARHGPHGIEPMSGEVIGFLIGKNASNHGIYVTGDTVWYEGVAKVAQRAKPKIVIAFAGGARPRGAYHVTMDNNDLIEIAAAFPGAKIVAIHNDGWAHYSESPEDTAKVFATFGLGDRLLKIAPGETIALNV